MKNAICTDNDLFHIHILSVLLTFIYILNTSCLLTLAGVTWDVLPLTELYNWVAFYKQKKLMHLVGNIMSMEIKRYNYP